MRPSVKRLLLELSKTISFPEPILEIGSLRVEGQEELANLRPLFPGKKYIGSDIRQGLGVDRILDIEDANMFSGSIGSIIMADTLEHIKHPFRAMSEAHRLLKPDGVIFISSVFFFPIHNYPNDYWRFTSQAFVLLMLNFRNVKVSFDGHSSLPVGIYGHGYK